MSIAVNAAILILRWLVNAEGAANARRRIDELGLIPPYVVQHVGDVRGSNPQPPSSQPGALAVKLTPPSESWPGKVGVEPTLAESEPAVLPLDDFPE
jgi:hypothetical protein